MNVGIDRIIRIGGQSHSEALEGKNLRTVAKAEAKSKLEKFDLAQSYKALEEEEKTAKRLLSLLHGLQKQPKWIGVKAFLMEKHPLIHRQFSRMDAEGFETVGREPFDVWATERSPSIANRSESPVEPKEATRQALAQANDNVYSLTPHIRRYLVAHWAEEIRENAIDKFFESVRAADDVQKTMTNIHDEVDRRVIHTADVVGITTTGLAKRIATLQRIRSKVIICEEAGEVMEPHIISALLPSVEHFIQIGDHEQLRPQINNFDLSLESQQGHAYQLDRSQFEWLSVGTPGKPPFPLAQLNVQRRMRPEISTLIRETTYPNLEDHKSTKNLPDVAGMRNNVFWLDHDNMEHGAQSDMHKKSHNNLWEVNMVHALVRHILRQGVYSSTEIAVLTPYTGQLQKTRTRFRDDFEIVLSERDQETLKKEGFDVDNDSSDHIQMTDQANRGPRPLQKKMMSELLRVATVDNFQGEEAKVIIVALIRSNKERKIGFLRTKNPINVLLSRAQHGMFLVGNADTYSNQPTWAHIQGMLRAAGSLDTAFALWCPRHPTTDIRASQPEDFARLSPQGGCQLPCDRRLPRCGHRCQVRCHSESMHEIFSCPQPYRRLLTPCRHTCQKSTCGEDCGLCMIDVSGVQLRCGHSKDNVSCHLTQHADNISCDIVVPKEIPRYGHTIDVYCFRDVNSESFECPHPCNSILQYKYLCPGTCYNRVDGMGTLITRHMLCTKICGRRYGTCNHTCPKDCHEGRTCGLCVLKCKLSLSLRTLQPDSAVPLQRWKLWALFFFFHMVKAC